MEFVWLIAGFILLIKGADWMVRAAAKLAKSFGVSTMVIGLTVVAIGTSMPEAAIGIMSAINHANQLTLGDVIGSSVANIALIIGFSAVIYPLKIQSGTLSRDIPLSLLIQIVFTVFLVTGNGINRLESILLLIGFIGFLLFLALSSKKSGNLPASLTENEPAGKPITAMRWRNSFVTLIGLICIAGGSTLIVDNAILIATRFGLSEALIGITIIALGTSLPELVVSIVSVSRKEHELMVGNIIGSNIFNVLFVIGISATINPIAFAGKILINLVLMLITSLFFLLLAHRKKQISRPDGIFLLSFYLLFLTISFLTS